jgi:hypothetical protein
MTLYAVRRIVLICVALALPGVSWAQSVSSGTIAGTVRDATGAVLPGVTVEAASPALIEKVRSAVTDAQGNYKIVELRPGAYTVTFTLPGFSTFKRDGLELTTGFTATANAELRIGALEETITVTGASPVVDVQNVRQQTVFRKDVQEALPLGRSIAQYASILPGATLSSSQHQDVGGVASKGAFVSIHGSTHAGMGETIDGLSFKHSGSTGGFGLIMNSAGVEEVAVQTSGVSAETQNGTLQLNIVPRDGGNTFRLTSSGSYAKGDFQANNIGPELLARGASGAGDLDVLHTINVGVGGPIRKDRLWFHTAHLWTGFGRFNPGSWFNATQDSFVYTPDLNRPALTDEVERDNQVRLTWQISQRHKLAVYTLMEYSCQCYFLQGSTVAPEASQRIVADGPIFQALWSHPRTNRLLFEAGGAVVFYTGDKLLQPGVTRDTIAVLDSSRNFRYRALGSALSGASAYGPDTQHQSNQRASMSYITGSHAFKVGMNTGQGWASDVSEINRDITYTLRGAVPQSVTLFASPAKFKDRARELGLFAQDNWTVSRWTLNLGIRYDAFRGNVPEQRMPAGTYVPARDFAPVEKAPDWKDLSPRLGASYDLFGNGKTALKASVARYVEWASAFKDTGPSNPARTMVASATRTWNDANGDYVPQESELGPLSNANFGKTIPGTRRDESVLRGWGVRPYTWQISTQVQHELRPGLGLNVGYFRNSYGNFVATDNLAVTPGDFSPYCLTTPRDSRLPGGGGQQICGLYDIVPAKFGLVDNLETDASKFGKQTRIFNGVDATVNMVFGKGGSISGGVATGATKTDNCDAIVDSPQKQFCSNSPSWGSGTQLKLAAIYPLPWGVRLSGTLQNIPGVPITATYVATNAEIAPSLGRNLGQCRGAAVCNGTLTVDLIEPNTVFEDRLTQLDLRLTRLFSFGRTRLQGNVDIFNVFNEDSVLGLNARYGPSWLQPTAILGGRMFKFGFQLDM